MKKSLLFTAVTFLSAFLMFQIELIISKIFLPRFGGSYLVWGACLVFFQCALLAGYWFAQKVMHSVGIGRYRPLHMLLLALPLIAFPGRGLGEVASHAGVPMVFDVFLQLLTSIGPVFFALSTSAVVFQSWLAASTLPQRRDPWVLYAVSNLGSFLALLTYPFLVEPFLSLSTQVFIWRIGYLFLLACGLGVFLGVRTEGPLSKPLKATAAIPLADRMAWFLFSAAGVVAFISVTNIITYEITPAPLLWIVPLCIYLVSFVFNFKRIPYCPAWIKDKFHLTAGWALLVFFLTLQRSMPIMVLFLAHAVILFSICMFCQHQLASRKPDQAAALPTFYLILSLGGFIGGVTVSWIMPMVTTSMLEYPLALLLIYLALSARDLSEPMGFANIRMIFYATMLLVVWPIAVKKYNVFALALIAWVFYAIFTRLKTSRKSIFLICAMVMAIQPFIEPLWTKNMLVFTKRNYYGIYYVYDNRGIRFLHNGTTLHGGQFIDDTRALEVLTYYHKDGPIGKLLTSSAFDFKRVGIVGLGVGGLAGYGRQGTSIDFYELDPDIKAIAQTFFSYVRKSPAAVNIIIGDARVNLEKAQGKEYDLIVIDAFSGDSIPTHLLTTEALGVYRRRLATGGIIIVHVSNRYLDLVPVLYSNASVLGAQSVMIKSDIVANYPPVSASVWVILTWNPEALRTLVTDLDWKREYLRPVKYVRPWSDDFSNILAVLRTQVFLNSIRFFQPFRW
jgi:spermidine synthase